MNEKPSDWQFSTEHTNNNNPTKHTNNHNLFSVMNKQPSNCQSSIEPTNNDDLLIDMNDEPSDCQFLSEPTNNDDLHVDMNEKPSDCLSLSEFMTTNDVHIAMNEKPNDYQFSSEFANINEILITMTGIKNLGNTCYMNACLQLLRVIPELHHCLTQLANQLLAPSPKQALVLALMDVFSQMDKEIKPVKPAMFFTLVRMVYPCFAAGKQHDAAEFLSKLLECIQEVLISENCNFKDKYFSGELMITDKCIDAVEQQQIQYDRFDSLICYIDPLSADLHDVIERSFHLNITKYCEALHCNATYERSQWFSSLPRYLNVHLVRQHAVNGKFAKVIHSIWCPEYFDVLDYCTVELQNQIMSFRNQSTCAQRNSGYYALRCVVTHTGRSLESGHYIAWVREASGHWLKIDDENLEIVQRTPNLAGSMDGDCAYILLYQLCDDNLDKNLFAGKLFSNKQNDKKKLVNFTVLKLFKQ
jgi:ubiquitin carboxyl-terminal hydrolase 14